MQRWPALISRQRYPSSACSLCCSSALSQAGCHHVRWRVVTSKIKELCINLFMSSNACGFLFANLHRGLDAANSSPLQGMFAICHLNSHKNPLTHWPSPPSHQLCKACLLLTSSTSRTPQTQVLWLPQKPASNGSLCSSCQTSICVFVSVSQRLQSQHRAQVRNADSPTGEMYGECQELLQMFGLPYIIAPMEAEAQCAWLDEAKLVDGVVTDDNDVFLFGGQHVYRSDCRTACQPYETCPLHLHRSCSCSCARVEVTRFCAEQICQARWLICSGISCVECDPWAAWYNTWLLIKLMPKGVVFSFSVECDLQHGSGLQYGFSSNH